MPEAKGADSEAKAKEGRNVIDVALKRYKRARAREKDNQDEALEDLRFRAGDQWPEKTKKEREDEDRPCLTINKIPQFIRQVTGDMRQMRPALKPVPIDSRGDVETADLIGGMIRHIENRSFARQVYTSAGDSQVGCGIGHWQIDTEYAHDSTFNQEIRILGIEDGISVLWDPDSVLPTREDAMFCFVPVDYSKDAFEERWPDAKSQDFGDSQQKFAEGWYGEDYVRVAAYWVKKPIKKLLALMPDGGIDDLTDEDEAHVNELRAKGVRVELRDSFEVCRYLITCEEVLEGPVKWKGRYIPIVPVIGEEVRIGRKVVRHGLIRFARDPQRMVNYYASAETETVALQPKAPFIATEDQVKKHRDIWDTANAKNHSVLIYSPDKNAPQAKPERVAPPVASQGIREGRMQANDDMKGVIGIYDASLGAKSNETSGVAIRNRQLEGDTGTFVYIDNFSLAIQHTGKIIVDLIPHVYDSERQQRIIGEDGKTADLVTINKRVIQDNQETTLNDVTIGAYDVQLEVGPSYTTKREEAREGMKEFIQAAPDAAPLIADIYAKAQDWPQAEEIGERLEVMLPPPIRAMIEAKKRGKGPDGQPLPPQPDPAQAEQLQAQQAQQQAEAAKAAGELEKIKLENRGKELDNERKQLELEAARLNAAGAVTQAQQPQALDPNAIAQAVAQALAPVVQRIDMLGEIVASVVAPPQAEPLAPPPPMQGPPQMEFAPDQPGV